MATFKELAEKHYPELLARASEFPIWGCPYCYFEDTASAAWKCPEEVKNRAKENPYEDFDICTACWMREAPEDVKIRPFGTYVEEENRR